MLFKKAILSSLVVAAICLGSGEANAQWDPVKQVKNVVNRGKKAARVEGGRAAKSLRRAHRMSYRVRIENPTNGFVNYSFAGERQVPLPRRKAVTLSGVGRTNISFKDGRGRTMRYNLGISGTYYFQWVNGRLNLFRK